MNMKERKKNERQEIRHHKMEGARVRSRAKWLSEGEIPTNYFCNLETRNFASKTMDFLLSSSGNVLKSQSEVLKEVEFILLSRSGLGKFRGHFT